MLEFKGAPEILKTSPNDFLETLQSNGEQHVPLEATECNLKDAPLLTIGVLQLEGETVKCCHMPQFADANGDMFNLLPYCNRYGVRVTRVDFGDPLFAHIRANLIYHCSEYLKVHNDLVTFRRLDESFKLAPEDIEELPWYADYSLDLSGFGPIGMRENLEEYIKSAQAAGKVIPAVNEEKLKSITKQLHDDTVSSWRVSLLISADCMHRQMEQALDFF